MKCMSAELPFAALPLYTSLSEDLAKQLPLLEEASAHSSFRPLIHPVPPCGLVNDPNGLHYDGKKYHMFCQWFPFGPRHGMKHWYHFTSTDLSDWQADENILIPDQVYEKNGCYSGNAWTDPETGITWLYYTANYKDKNLNKIPLQAAACIEPDGTLKKSARNPIIYGSPAHVGKNIRDPFVFDYGNSTWMLIGAESDDACKKGMLLLYKMDTPESFTYQGEVQVLCNGKHLDLGNMLECPGLIQADGTDLLFLSIIGDVSRQYSPNRFASIVLTGKFDPEKRIFEAENIQNADEGFDFYAPQPFYGENETPMVVGWFGNGDQPLPEDQEGWRHSLTLPRTIQVVDGVLKMPPAKGACRKFPKAKEFWLQKKEDTDTICLLPDSLEHVHLFMEDNQKVNTLKIGTESDFYTIVIDCRQHTLTVDRSMLKTPVDPAYGMKRTFAFTPKDHYEIDLLIDRSFHELYWNQGEKVLSFRAYLPQNEAA